jgi:hypothetical protein
VKKDTQAMRLKRVLWTAANLLGGAVLVLLLVDPTRPLLPIFILLGLGVVFMALPAYIGRSGGGR